MTITGRASVLLVITAMAAAGCGTAGSTGPQRSPAAVAAQPASPVPILRETGAHVPAGVRLGGWDVFGDRMATGTMARFEQVTVYTARSSSALRVMLTRQTFAPQDGTGVVVIPAKRAAILVSGWEDNGPRWAAGGRPAQIARRVHGQLIGG